MKHFATVITPEKQCILSKLPLVHWVQTLLNFTVNETFPLDNSICLKTGIVSECNFCQSIYCNSDCDTAILLFSSYGKKKFLH